MNSVLNQEKLNLRNLRDDINQFLRSQKSSLQSLYWQSIESFLAGSLSKNEFDACIKICLGSDHLFLHNQFIHTLFSIISFLDVKTKKNRDYIFPSPTSSTSIATSVTDRHIETDSILLDSVNLDDREKKRIFETFSSPSDSGKSSQEDQDDALLMSFGTPIYDMPAIFCLSSNTGRIVNTDEIKGKLLKYIQYFGLDDHIDEGLIENIQIALKNYLYNILTDTLSLILGQTNLSTQSEGDATRPHGYGEQSKDQLKTSSLQDRDTKSMKKPKSEKRSLIHLTHDRMMQSLTLRPSLVPQNTSLLTAKLNLSCNL